MQSRLMEMEAALVFLGKNLKKEQKKKNKKRKKLEGWTAIFASVAPKLLNVALGFVEKRLDNKQLLLPSKNEKSVFDLRYDEKDKTYKL